MKKVSVFLSKKTASLKVEYILGYTNKVSNYVDPLKGQNGQSYDYSAPLNTNVTVAARW